jgi:branched-subunit amino acid aminotransferase/4-amino-4-deoxychorismate lyase
MAELQLFAVTAHGPLALRPPAGASEVHDLLDGLPLGVYTALRTFEHHKFLRLEEHLGRLKRSMALLGWEMALDERALRRALDQVARAYPLADARVRIDVLARPALALGTDSRLLIALAPFTPVPAEAYRDGVRVGIARELSRPDPQIKQASFVRSRRPYQQANPALYEWLIVDAHGRLLEGMSSNFYAVIDRVLWTAGQGVLEGVARTMVLEVAKAAGIAVRLEPPLIGDLERFAEAALSSASRAIVPIVEIERHTVGAGRPGPVIDRLLEGYRRLLAQELRTAI